MLRLIVGAPGFSRKELQLQTQPDPITHIEVELKPQPPSGPKIILTNLEVSIAEEVRFVIISTGQQLTLQEYRNYVRQCVLQAVTEHITLRDLWIDSNRRKDFLETLRKARAEPQVLDRALHKEDTDTFDLLCHVTFGDPIRTRNERVTAFQNREQAFLQRHSPKDQEVLFELLDKYRVDGIDNLEYCHLIPFPPLAERRRIVAHLRAVQEKVRALKEAQARKDLQQLEEAILDHAFRGKL